MKDPKRVSATTSTAAAAAAGIRKTTVNSDAVSLAVRKSDGKSRIADNAKPGRRSRSAVINGQQVSPADFQRQVREVMADPSPADMARLLERKRTGTNESRRGRPPLGASIALSRSLNVRFDPETYAWIWSEAERSSTSMGDVVRKMLDGKRRSASK